MSLEESLLSILKRKPLGNYTERISTFELCRLLNGVRERRFCHKHRTSEKRGNGNFGGAQNPTCDCSNDIVPSCRISWRTTFQSLLKMERRGVVHSSRRRCIDTKRMPNSVQISKDTYRLWEIEEFVHAEGMKVKE